MMKNILVTIFVSFVFMHAVKLTDAAQGRAPDWIGTINQAIQEQGVSDTRYLEVEEKEFLEVNRDLKVLLAAYENLNGVNSKKTYVMKILTQAQALDLRARELELNRIPNMKLTHLAESYNLQTDSVNPKSDLIQKYKEQSFEALSAEKEMLETFLDEKSIDDYIEEITDHLEKSITAKGRGKRKLKYAPLSPFVNLWIANHILTDDRSAHVANFEKERIYAPKETSEGDPATLGDEELLAYFSPVVIVEDKKHKDFNEHVDQIGHMALTGADVESAMPFVDTGRPTLYTYNTNTTIHGILFKQLVYTLWFPEHPHIHGEKDPEAGLIEGWTLRITLDQSNQPIFYESVANCGCYYKIFPTTRAEEYARAEFGKPLRKKEFSIEQKVKGKIDATVPELVESVSGAHPVALYYESATHQMLTIQSNRLEASSRDLNSAGYELLPYEELENLPFRDHTLSLFEEDGLVRGAHRRECKLLAPTGMYHAGHPRQRETQMVYFDQAEFDDPTLLETYLRVPKRLVSETT